MSSSTMDKGERENRNAALAAELEKRIKASPGKQPPPKILSPAGPPMYISPIVSFCIFFAGHLLSAVVSPIQDCDEVFNFWEPTHYLTHGYGFETWEYSPEYMIRSWAYIAVHALVTGFARLLPFVGSKAFQFYFLRATLGLVCAGCEAKLYTVISQTLNQRIGAFFMIIMVTSSGMFHASTAFLPSSFAMYTTMLGTAEFMDWRGGIHTAPGMFWIGLGSVLAWPFAGAMVFPFIGEDFLLGALNGQAVDAAQRIVWGATRIIVIQGVQLAVDVFFYRQPAFVPFNIVWYNVIAAREGKGPNIYGTEPWHYYFRNLILNFNVWFILALAAMPILLVQEFIRRKPASKQSYLRNITFLVPFYLWLAIFTLQPHKEERFMYPLYPCLALNAAMTIHILLGIIGSTSTGGLMSKIPVQVRLAFVGLCFLGAVDLGILRTLGTVTGYGAPLSIYQPLHEPRATRNGDNVCMGKEWYRYPTSFLLPNSVKAKFIKSEFSGLLPGEFSQAKVGHGMFPGAWLVPPGMNDENLEDPGKYTSINQCNFLVDSSFPGQPTTALEPDYVHDTENWEQVKCVPFLDTTRTSILGRLIWIPDLEFVPQKFRRKWGEYCLLKRKINK